jgi:HD-like signal output (HDOD) protein
MKAAIIVVFIFFIGLIIFMLIKKQEPHSNIKKNQAKVRRQSTPQQGPAVSSLNKEQRNIIELNRESIQSGLKSIFSHTQFDFLNETLPIKRSDTRQELYIAIKNCIGDMREFSSVYKISNMLDDPQVDLSQIAKIVSTDPILSNKILRSANSAYFGSGKSVDSINHALAILGFVNIKSILFHNVLSKKFSAEASLNPELKVIWDHSIKAALCAVYLSDAFEGLHRGKLYTLGLMHDVGKFILPRLVQGRTCDTKVIIPYGEKLSILREDELYGVNHAVISRAVLEDSGISEQLLKVIEIHHYPLFTHKSFHLSKNEDQKYLTALYLANQIAKLFAKQDEKYLFAVQPLPPSYQGFINRLKLDNIFNDERIIADISKSGSFIEFSN